jgi:hypothetical protein
MADPKIEALRRGHVPVSPAWTGWWIALGGGLGALAGLSAAPWRALATAGFSGHATTWALARATLWSGAGGSLAGAVAGLVVAQITLGAWAPGWRLKADPMVAPRHLGLSAVLAVSAVGALLPLAVGTGHTDLGALVIRATLAGWGLGALGALGVALIERARARRRWLADVEPDQSRW